MNSHTEITGNKSKIWRRVLLLLAAVITALAVAVTCALSIDTSKTVSSVDDGAELVDIRTSATTRNNVEGNYTGSGSIINGDVFNYTTTNRYYTLTLPKGDYKLEAYGAQGGTGNPSIYGGYGGYSYGTISLPEATTMYVTVGGQGSSLLRSSSYTGGGYNGGGGVKTQSGSGGGGASDIRIGSNTLYYRVLVAGGGGGGGWSVTANRYTGRGGGTSGAAAGNSGSWSGYARGLGASQTAAGGISGSNTGGGAQGTAQAGSFGTGGRGAGSSSGGGGGGGGWYGGGGGFINGGGGGSGFVLTTSMTSSTAALPSAYFGNKTSNTAAYYKYRMKDANTTTSSHTGNGSIKITVINVNQAPVSEDYNIPTVPLRGTTNLTVGASTLAKDKDYTNISGGNVNNVYFTQGLTSNCDTAPIDNNGLFMDQACTINASSYMTYTWSGATATTKNTLNITSITKLPRAGVDGQTTNNTFTLYTKVRDNFGSATTRGVGVAKFTLSVQDRGITVKDPFDVPGKFRLGQSTHNTDEDRTLDYINNGNIYNPLGKNVTTLFIPKSMSPSDTEGYTIKASDIFTDADTQYDKVAFKTVTVLPAYSQHNSYYNLQMQQDSSYATGLFPSFTLKPSGLRPTGAPYVVMQITAQTSENNSKAQIGAVNNTVYLVFRISNTRPYLGSTEQLTTKKAEPFVKVAPGQSQPINLKEYLTDIDDGENLKATFAQGANDLKVPENEYIQVDMSNTEVPLADNVGSNYYGRSAVNTTDGQLSSKTGEGDAEHPTHFNQWSIAANGSRGAATANVTYRYIDNQTIEFTGRAATQNQYRDNNGATDANRKGHFYILVRIVDSSDMSDSGIWMPIAIEVTSQAPTEPSTFANVTLGFSGVDGGSDSPVKDPNKGTGDSVYLTPIGYLDTDGNFNGVGALAEDADAFEPFAFDPDAFSYNDGNATLLNDFVTIDETDPNGIILDNDVNTTGTFFEVTTQPIFAPKSYFSLIPEDELSNYGLTLDENDHTVSFTGIKITAKRTTNGKFFQFRVRVKDSHGEPGSISICVKVENRDVFKRLDPDCGMPDGSYKMNVLQDRAAQRVTPYGTYEVNNNLGSNKVAGYTIEAFDTLKITPYDFAYDFDTDPEGLINKGDTLNSNPQNDGFNDVKALIGKPYTVAATDNPGTGPDDKVATAVTAQALGFVNPGSIESYGVQYSNYISVSVDNNTVDNIPTISITGVSRTASAIVQLHFTVTDGTTNVNCMITVTVLNSAPMLNPQLDNYYKLSSNTLLGTSSAIPNILTFEASSIAYDKDKDTPIFVAGSAKVVAKDGDEYYDTLYYDETDETYYSEMGDGRKTVELSDYINVTITKGTNGADVLRLQGLSSTEIFNLPVYIEFTMRDGYRAQEQRATLHLLVEVVNNDPIFVSDGLLQTGSGDNSKYTWMIGYEYDSEKAQSRYIFNSRELYNNNNLYSQQGAVINIREDNKLYLFDDYDSQQRAILNPASYRTRDDIVKKYYGNERFTESDFATGDYENAAVVFTPMYKDNRQEESCLNVRVRYFAKSIDEKGVVRFDEVTDSADVSNCEYWVIEIIDTILGQNPSEVQIAISVKDSHHGKNLYTDPDKATHNEDADVSEYKVANLFYNYRKPGIMALHTYYRTDGNVESGIYANGNDDTDGYLVDPLGVTASDFDAEETEFKAAYTEASKNNDRATMLNILRSVKFTEEFKYRYFEKTYQGESGVEYTFKHFPSSENKFAYSPIKVDPSSKNPVIVPMSYIALLQGATSSSLNGNHVTFANAGKDINPSAGNILDDDDYLSWTTEDIASNLTISDGTKTYSIDKNPYVVITYYTKGGSAVTADEKFINKQRFTVDPDQHDNNSPNDTQPTYHEDNLGFVIRKKENGQRANGLLKLTLALKTIGSDGEEGLVEMVEVEIDLIDSVPDVVYHDGYSNQATFVNSYCVNRVSSVMTIGNTERSTISLVNQKNVTGSVDSGTVGKIFYTDADVTDSMKFYMPSAYGRLSEDEIKSILQGSSRIEARNLYYNVDSSNKISQTDVDEAGKVNPYKYEPNPNYDMFFDVSPAVGSSESLQFIPKAKTIPVFPNDVSAQEYYDKYNLMVETDANSPNNGKVYYPFRVLFYDECNGSEFTKGHWFAALIKVFIENDPIKVDTGFVGNDTYRPATNQNNVPADYNKAPMYKLMLSTSTEFYVDATTLLNDDDIVLTRSGTFATKDDSAWTDLTHNNVEESYLRDYIVMPDANDYVYLSAYEKGMTSAEIAQIEDEDLPFQVINRDTPTDDNRYGNLPRTTLVFKAKNAFRDPIRIGYRFRDSGSAEGSYAYVVFSLEYNNEAPTPNRASFGSTNTIDISMMSGETFYLYASDYTQFDNDRLGGFDSYKSVKTDIYDNAAYSYMSKLSAEDMSASFKFFTSVYGTDGPSGDSLVLASDDAPTTLRILDYSISNNAQGKVTVSPSVRVNRENATSAGWLRMQISASAVISTNLSITLGDNKDDNKVTVNVRINVISSAPEVKGESVNNQNLKLEYTGNSTYKLDMTYGDVKAISLTSLMRDDDVGDDQNFSVYKNMDGSLFSVENPGENAVLDVTQGKNNSSVNHVIIKATDFINRTGDQANVKVRFRVQDEHGALSDYVTIVVNVKPSTVTAVSPTKAFVADVMSYATFIDADGNAGNAQEIDIIDSAGAAMFKDADVDAPSAQYNVQIYVLLECTESGAVNKVNYNPEGNNIMLYSRTGSSDSYNTSSPEAKYVQQFFTLSVSEDGKTVLFIPNSATISQNSMTDIPLYIVVQKRYADGKTMDGVGAPMGVKVANSKLQATEDSSLNVGYPTVDGSDTLRNSPFLSFTGSKGDSLTWNLYDVQDAHLGLFYDYDMINGTQESIKYLDYSYTVPNETSNTNVPVLAVSYNENTKALTIKINRNVATVQPPAEGKENEPTEIEVSIFAVDAINNVAGVTKNDKDRVSVTKIKVNVCNDRPEIAETGLVEQCPYCGNSENIRQISANTAKCGACNKEFKSLDPEQLGYTLSNDSELGYILNARLERGKSLKVSIADIIDDADIDMDVYVMLNTGNDNSLMDRNGNTASSMRAGDETAFDIKYNTGTNAYSLSTLKELVFTCKSVQRGAVAECTVKFRDSYIGSETSTLTIRLTVDNIAPTVKANTKTDITVMGVGGEAEDAAVADAAKVYSILDFVDDANGDNFDPTTESGQRRKPTYTYIDKIEMYTIDDDIPANRPDIFGPNLMITQPNPETGEDEEYYATSTVCTINWLDDDITKQKFKIQPIKGVYGVQKVILQVYDSGSESGIADNVLDGKMLTLTLTVTIANPLDDVEEVLPPKAMVYGVTRTIATEDLLGEDNAKGYKIINMEEIDTHYLRIISPDGDEVSTSADGISIGDWRIYASTESVSTKVKVTFSIGDLTRERILPIEIVANNKPVYKNGTSTYRYTVSMLDDKEQRTIKIRPTDWFEDSDLEDVMTFISPVSSSQSVKVEVVRAIDSAENGGQPYILLKFHRRGEAVITVNLIDLSNRSYTYEVVVECTDAPELSWWENTVSLIENNWMWFWIIVGGALVLIILLIIIIVVVHKKRKMRREIEALLESETELEEEMLRLSSGAAYQSFGYLPPTQQGAVNPGMMLGGGSGAPQPNNLQLNAGAGPAVNNIPPTRPQTPPQTPPQQTPPRSNDGFDPDNF